jgi:HK97 family phage major capsid protein
VPTPTPHATSTRLQHLATRLQHIAGPLESLPEFQQLAVEEREAVAALLRPADAPFSTSEFATAAGFPSWRSSREYAGAFDAYLRRGMAALDHEQQTLLGQGFNPETRAPMGVGSGAIGGYMVPPGFVTKITDTLKQFGGMLRVANVISTDNGQPLQWPTVDDTANVGAILPENNQAVELDVTVGTKTLGAYMYTSKLVLLSFQLLQDSAFDLNTWLPMKLGQRIGRAVNAHLTTGTGTSQPTGIQPTLTVGKQGIVGQTTTVIYDDLVDVVHSLDPAYRDGASWMMNDSSLKIIQKLKDGQNRPLLEPATSASLAAGMPNTLLGYPIVTNQDWPAMAASARSIGFGRWDLAYTVRRVNDVAVLRLSERYADFLQVGFLAFVRFDGVPDDAAAARCYQNSAT